MTKLKAIHTKNAPSAIGVYSQAVKAGGFMYVSGQIPLVPETMEIVSEDFNVQIKQVLENLKAIIIDSDSKLSDVVKLNVYLNENESRNAIGGTCEGGAKRPPRR